ncbi:MAG: EVE domain-containing protein [Paracoccaceae bacterium]
MRRYWVGVASRDHVKIGEAEGFCQLAHGKEAPLRRLSLGDGLLYYAPRTGMRTGERIQAFVAIGKIANGGIYRARQAGNFCPFRRDVDYFSGSDTPISGLMDRLSFTKNSANWGLLMRRGLFEITHSDFTTVANAMGVGASVEEAFL